MSAAQFGPISQPGFQDAKRPPCCSPSAACASLIRISIQNLHLLPSRQHRLQHPFPNLAPLLQYIRFQRQPRFQRHVFAIRLDALRIQLHIDAIQRFIAARLGNQLLRQIGR